MLAHRIKSLFLVGVLLAGVLGITSVTIALEIGEKAPDFTLPSTMGRDISLSEFLGKKSVLIEFYGADFEPT
jgi:peroxiredoxin Q/BCP